MKTVFVNPETGLLRAGWRILIFLVLFVAVTMPIMMGVRAILGGLRGGSTLQFVLLGIGATISAMIARRYLDRKPIGSLGIVWDRHALPDLLSGVLNSALVMAVMYFLLLGLGLIEFNGYTWWQNPEAADTSMWFVIGSVALQLAAVAWWEELVFRGYLFQNMKEGLGLVWAIVLSSLIFGVGHIFNPNASLIPTLIIALIALQLVYAFVKTGRLWMPVGLHLGWNFFQASVFGFASSGQDSPSMIAQSPIGPEWLSGGAFGAEASIFILPVTLLSMVAIHYWVKSTRYPQQGAWDVAEHMK